jgi:hypothetical protein
MDQVSEEGLEPFAHNRSIALTTVFALDGAR